MATTKPVPSVTFAHVGFYVRDMALMEGFFTRVLGFTVTDRGSLPGPQGAIGLVFLSRDPEEHHQIVLATGRPRDTGFNVINKISFRVPDVAALRHFHGALQGEPVSEIAGVTRGNAISIYFKDPEGNRIELFFDTPWYCAQPCREMVDFRHTDAQILAATEALARSRPGFQSREAWVGAMGARMAARA